MCFCSFFPSNHNFKPSSLSSNLHFPLFLFTALITTCTDVFGRLLMNDVLTDETCASWKQSWHQLCLRQSPFRGLTESICQYAFEYFWFAERGVVAFKPWPLCYVPLPNANEPCREPQTALSKQLCQNILCWWRLQSVTWSFLINWWGTATAHSAVTADLQMASHVRHRIKFLRAKLPGTGELLWDIQEMGRRNKKH